MEVSAGLLTAYYICIPHSSYIAIYIVAGLLMTALLGTDYGVGARSRGSPTMHKASHT